MRRLSSLILCDIHHTADNRVRILHPSELAHPYDHQTPTVKKWAITQFAAVFDPLHPLITRSSSALYILPRARVVPQPYHLGIHVHLRRKTDSSEDVLAQVGLNHNIPAHTIEMRVPPHPQPQLIMPVEGAGIDYIGLSVLLSDPILPPQSSPCRRHGLIFGSSDSSGPISKGSKKVKTRS